MHTSPRVGLIFVCRHNQFYLKMVIFEGRAALGMPRYGLRHGVMHGVTHGVTHGVSPQPIPKPDPLGGGRIFPNLVHSFGPPGVTLIYLFEHHSSVSVHIRFFAGCAFWTSLPLRPSGGSISLGNAPFEQCLHRRWGLPPASITPPPEDANALKQFGLHLSSTKKWKNEKELRDFFWVSGKTRGQNEGFFIAKQIFQQK